MWGYLWCYVSNYTPNIKYDLTQIFPEFKENIEESVDYDLIRTYLERCGF